MNKLNYDGAGFDKITIFKDSSIEAIDKIGTGYHDYVDIEVSNADPKKVRKITMRSRRTNYKRENGKSLLDEQGNPIHESLSESSYELSLGTDEHWKVSTQDRQDNYGETRVAKTPEEARELFAPMDSILENLVILN